MDSNVEVTKTGSYKPCLFEKWIGERKNEDRISYNSHWVSELNCDFMSRSYEVKQVEAYKRYSMSV